MKYNPLIDTPPPPEFGGVYFETDFRAVLEYIRIIDNPNIEDIEKSEKIFEIFFREPPKFDIERLKDFLPWFILCGENEGAGGSSKRTFDWTTDAGRIYAAFLQVYKIDLADKSVKFHWWNFKQLFDALPNGTKLSEVVEIRSKEISTKDTPENRKAIARLQALYSIDRPQPE